MNEIFLDRMKEYLTANEFQKLLSSYKKQPVRGLRINQIDPDIFLNKSQIPLEKISYDPNGYYINGSEKYGNHPYHHLGAFYLQEPSAMAPVNLIDFKGDEMVLDLCAAPGGKSSQIATRIPDGILFSNEINYKRSKALFSNMERLGFSNVIVLNETPKRLSTFFKGFFDVILVDAPCSGEGMMRKDPVARDMWSKALVLECQKRDYEILDYAYSMLKQGGKLIYSTCTFSKEENEMVVDFLLKDKGLELLSLPDQLKPFTKEGFIPNTLRFYPFTGKGEGQFMAAFIKNQPQEINVKVQKFQNRKNNELKIVLDFIEHNLDSIDLKLEKYGNRYYAVNTTIDLSGFNVLNYGIELGEVFNKRFIPYHHMFKALGKYFKNKLILDINDTRVERYLHGEEILADIPNGYGVIEIDGLYLGGFKAVNGHLKNHYPKGLRNINILEVNS